MTDGRAIEFGLRDLAMAIREYGNIVERNAKARAVIDLRTEHPTISLTQAIKEVEEIYNGKEEVN